MLETNNHLLNCKILRRVIIMDQDKISKFIKEIRTKEHLSQQKFAEKYGVTYQAVSKWENGKNMPDITILKQICSDYGTNLDSLLDTKVPKPKKKKLGLIILIVAIVILAAVLLLFYLHTHNDDFQFKTLSTTCDNFNLYGSIAYDSKKSSIYISHITYCGKEDHKKYQQVECTLYETNNNTKTSIGHYSYKKDKEITLEEFLKNVNFNINHYDKTCKAYTENSLHLEIDATDLKNEVTTYKIPLKIKDNCTD